MSCNRFLGAFTRLFWLDWILWWKYCGDKFFGNVKRLRLKISLIFHMWRLKNEDQQKVWILRQWWLLHSYVRRSQNQLCLVRSPGHYSGKSDCLVLPKQLGFHENSREIGQKNSQKPWSNRFHPKYRHDLDSACLQIVFITTLFWRYLWIWILKKIICILSCLSIFYERTTQTAKTMAIFSHMLTQSQ